MKEIKISSPLIEALIDSECGMTLTSLKYKGQEVIIYDQERKAKGGTYAIPILFPTPNRTEGGEYRYEEKVVKTKMHGFIRHMNFELTSIKDESVIGRVVLNKSEEFPYSIEFEVEIRVENNTVSWLFRVKNNGDNSFPFGIALHPFFIKSLFNKLVSDCTDIMETNTELIPTGITHKVSGKEDFSKGRDVDEIEVDAVFFKSDKVTSTLISSNFSLEIKGSEEFNHVVIFTGKDKPFICVEPQTCSTNFINLYNKGFKNEANLLEVKGSEEKRLRVDFIFK